MYYRCLWWQFNNDSYCGLYANRTGNKSSTTYISFRLGRNGDTVAGDVLQECGLVSRLTIYLSYLWAIPNL